MTQPITIPAIIPPDGPLLLVGIDTWEAVGSTVIQYWIVKYVTKSSIKYLKNQKRNFSIQA